MIKHNELNLVEDVAHGIDSAAQTRMTNKLTQTDDTYNRFRDMSFINDRFFADTMILTEEV